MRVIGKDIIEDFCRKHSTAAGQMRAWLAEAENAVWRTPQDVKDRYNSASFLHDNIVIFNIRGNHYRVVIKVNYPMGIVRVKWAGTHKEYDRQRW